MIFKKSVYYCWFVLYATFKGVVSFASSVPAIEGGDAAVGHSASPAAQGGWLSLAPLPLMFAVLYFLVLRPQQKKIREQQSLIASLKQGDEVITASGILGKVAGMTDQVVTLEIADGVRMKILRNQVTQIVKGSLKDAIPAQGLQS